MTEHKSSCPIPAQQETSPLEPYKVHFACDVPRFATVEISAPDDADAIVRAKDYWKAAHKEETPPLAYHVNFEVSDSQNAILHRILGIDDADGNEIASDIRLDGYVLTPTYSEFDARIVERAKHLFAALKAIAARDVFDYDSNDAEHEALGEIIAEARDALAPIEDQSTTEYPPQHAAIGRAEGGAA